ncbi:hypothetical protein SDC9_207692 [bioreactor metagenome]|uniref:Uncharacterized protein n=1 Tax=bioreactor metagenome TaxID=1076179 RepID=A0A645JB56_9ZZZZ
MRCVASFRGYYQFATWKELLTHFHGLLEQSPWIPAQVQHQCLHALLSQFLDGLVQFVAGLFPKLNQADVTNPVIAQRKLLLAIDILYHVHADRRAGKRVFLDFPRRRTEH